MDELAPLLEELIKLRPDDSAVLKKAAEIALKNNHPQKALFFYSKLADNIPDDSTIFQQIALIQESLGNTKKAAAYWQEVVGLDPLNRSANIRLIDYYKKLGNGPMELKHIEVLLELTPTDSEFLERAAQLHEQMGRPDRALEYYDRLLSLQPLNNEVKLHKEHAVQQLALQLLSLVENSGSDMLWQDLVRVTDDRTAVYRAMASLLRQEQGKHNELIEVLLVINHESPADIAIRDELIALIKEQGRDDLLVSVWDVDSTPPVSLPQ
jgi:tetratricopeptide (TPR) repeat protein